jgi:hypothetical protein
LKANHNLEDYFEVKDYCDSTTNLIKKEHFETTYCRTAFLTANKSNKKRNHNILLMADCDSTTNLIKKEHFESKSQLTLGAVVTTKESLRFYYKSNKKRTF